MTHVWSGLSTCHLQAYPSRMQMLSSQRKDNVPKRCFPDNLGQQSGIALLWALCWETRPTVLNRSFSRFKQAKSYLHILAFFFWAHPGMPQNCHCLEKIRKASFGTKVHSGPCCLVFLSFWTGHTILIITQAKKLMKTKVQSLKPAQPWWNSKLTHDFPIL